MKSKTLIGAGLAAALVVVAAAAAFWYFVLRDDAPEAVSLAGALESLSPTAGSGAAPSETKTTATQAPAAALTGLAGNWSAAAASETFVGYRVKEELAQVGFTTAVGRTSDVTAAVVVQGNSVTSGKITANLSALKSDRSQRDNALRQQALETGRYPTATFELTSPVSIPDNALQGAMFAATLKGKLTLHGVTRDVSVPVEGQVSGNLLVVVGSIEIVFADYNIAQPRAQAVLSIEDRGTMEFQLFLAKS